MAQPIDVTVTGRGRILNGQAERDDAVRAKCSLCGSDAEAVATIAAAGETDRCACAACLRARLDALSVARYRLADASGLPWGKVSG